jgi:succinyl-CoA synthetase beta subunit
MVTMRLYENEAKRLFQMTGITIPRQYGTISAPDGLGKLNISYPAMLKSMVLVGGRGKAGGIKKVNDAAEAKDVVTKFFSLRIKGYSVNSVLVEEAVEHSGACYVGITMDPDTYNNILIVSASGGVDIEEVARSKPAAMKKVLLPDNAMKLAPSMAKKMGDFLAKGLNADKKLAEQLADVVAKVYTAYQEFDAKVCEINPLLVTSAGPVAADAKIVLDDNALFRQTRVLDELGLTGRRHEVAEPTANEVRADRAGFKYVDLLPEGAKKEADKLYVGLVPGGAGYGIFSIDEVANVGDKFFGGKVVPVNFMDSGGGPTQSGVAEMFHLLMDYELVDLIITSRFGGISSCDIFIRGLVQALRERRAKSHRVVPVYGRMVGTDLPSAHAYLDKVEKESPEMVKEMHIIIGNQKVMVDVIKDGIAEAFEARGWKA